MTELLIKAIERLAALPPESQDDLARKLLVDLSARASMEARHPTAASRTASDAEALVEACRQGWLTPPKVVSEDPPPRCPIAPLDQLLEELQADREDR